MENDDIFNLEINVQLHYDPIVIPKYVKKMKITLLPRKDTISTVFVIDEILNFLPEELEYLQLTSHNLDYSYCISGDTLPPSLLVLEVTNINLKKGLAFKWPPKLQSYNGNTLLNN